MAKVRIMYWKEIPVQVQAEDESGAVSRPLDARFQQGVDAISMLDGSAGSDDYLMGWGVVRVRGRARLGGLRRLRRPPRDSTTASRRISSRASAT